jgi:hypothetical protein
VVTVGPGDVTEMVKVRAVARGGQEVRFECFAGEHEVAPWSDAALRG